MLSEQLIQEARKQNKIALAQVNYSYRQDELELGRYSIINHPLLKRNILYEVNTEIIGGNQGWQRIRGS